MAVVKYILAHIIMVVNLGVLCVLGVIGATEYFLKDVSPTGWQWLVALIIFACMLCISDSSIGNVTRRSLFSVLVEKKIEKLQEEVRLEREYEENQRFRETGKWM